MRPRAQRGTQHSPARNIGRLSASRLGTVTATEAIVRQDGRRPSNAATGGGRPLLLPDARSGSGPGAARLLLLCLLLRSSWLTVVDGDRQVGAARVPAQAR